MIEEITRRCHAVAPLADVHLVDLPPVAGAALLGLDAIGASAEVEGRLRAHYAPEAEERLVAG
jgi:hypothetical protein